MVYVFFKKRYSLFIFLVAIGVATGFAAWQSYISHDDDILYARSTLFAYDGHVRQALFSPGGSIERVLCGLIKDEDAQILVLAYMLTNQTLAEELIRAYKRGIRIEVIVDGPSAQLSYSKVSLLHDAGIPVYFYYTSASKKQSSYLMHNKVMLFNQSLGRQLLVTGSYNFTKAAERNAENILVLDTYDLIQRYRTYFEELKMKCVRSHKRALVQKTTFKKKKKRSLARRSFTVIKELQRWWHR